MEWQKQKIEDVESLEIKIRIGEVVLEWVKELKNSKSELSAVRALVKIIKEAKALEEKYQITQRLDFL